MNCRKNSIKHLYSATSTKSTERAFPKFLNRRFCVFFNLRGSILRAGNFPKKVGMEQPAPNVIRQDLSRDPTAQALIQS